MTKKYVIPIFVPHLGCPHDCTFCNQKKISGEKKQITKDDVKKTIDYFLEHIKEPNGNIEVAFFGGSFTGIDEKIQNELLEAAYFYVREGKIDSIRISTRPDYINKDILKRLKKYKVKTIELGVQSTNDYILKKAERGHTFQDVKKASKLIRRYGFVLGHQMMVGLQDSTRLDEIKTAKSLIKLKPSMVRIYPVLVIRGTKLAKEYEEDNYKPLTVVQAVEICKELVTMFKAKNIDVIRIGLQNTDEITSPEIENSEVIAGPYHPAFRQLVESSLWYDAIVNKIKKLNVKVKEVRIEVNSEDVNNVIGHKKENLKKLKEVYDVDVNVKANDEVKQGKIKVEVLKVFEN